MIVCSCLGDNNMDDDVMDFFVCYLPRARLDTNKMKYYMAGAHTTGENVVCCLFLLFGSVVCSSS